MKYFISLLSLLFSTFAFGSSYQSLDDLMRRALVEQFQEGLRNSHQDLENWDALVVVDMQDEFESSLNFQLRVNIQNLLEKAMAEGRCIIFLEYEGYKETTQELLQRVEDYPFVLRLSKKQDSGLSALLTIFAELDLKPFQNLQICGVNTNCCVFKTADDLRENGFLKSLTIFAHSCNAETKPLHKVALKYFRKLPHPIPTHVDFTEGIPFQ